MELSTAIQLIQNGVSKTTTPQRWVDLGAGSGLFTQALASCLPANSYVLAIDRNIQSLNSMTWASLEIKLETLATDFELLDWPGNLDGILMANSLHFVKDQQAFLKKIKEKLTGSGRIIIVEYDTLTRNTWVPFPLDFRKLTTLAPKSALKSVIHLAETPSSYQQANIYSALLQ
jgi:ubiquinone/menaquinone biosynthesis C-methylase UbiE